MNANDKEQIKVALVVWSIFWGIVVLFSTINDGVEGFIGSAIGLPLLTVFFFYVFKVVKFLFKSVAPPRPKPDFSKEIEEWEKQNKKYVLDLIERDKQGHK
jgi:uncharacterized membrane protein